MILKARVAGNAPSAGLLRRLAAAIVPAFVGVITSLHLQSSDILLRIIPPR
jgi:hypothetical protein